VNVGDLLSMIFSRLNPTPFIVGWVETRPWRLLLAGLPVLMAIAGAVTLRASMDDANSDAELRHYLIAGSEMHEAGDEKAAELRFRRASLIAPTDPRPKFGLATITEMKGDLKKATAMMEALASGDDDVARQANRWLIAKTPRKDLDTAGRQLLLNRLERAVEFEPANLDYRLSLADLYALAGFRTHAVKHLRVAAESRPVHRLRILQLLALEGDQEALREEAAVAERHFRGLVEKEPGDFDSRLLCAWAMVFQKRYREAVELLEEAALINEPVPVRKAVAVVNIAWARDLLEQKGDTKQVLTLTAAALKADPSNMNALMLLTDLTRDVLAGKESVGLLKQKLAAGETPWLIHLVLGTRSLELGNLKEGEEHLEQAVKLNPTAAVAMNNLAWTLANQEPPDLGRAETLAAQAVQHAPGNPQIRETRGQIYLKQRRWKEALTDLEAVLPIYSNEADLIKQLPYVHESLATAYENLGNADMARRHRELRESTKQLTPPK
jgi:tetratricopeptide (TPR) repeat protein